jgi:transcriptional regulator with XRE-family HTH domain
VEILKKKRRELGLSYEALGARCSLAPMTVWNIEHGRTQPNLKSLRALSRGLGVPVSELIKDNTTKEDEALMQELAEKVHKGDMSAGDAIQELRKFQLLQAGG